MDERIRALIVDDEPAARRGIALLLQRHADVEVVGQSVDGLEAVAAIGELEPDLVFLDVQMPGLDGFEVLERIGPEGVPAVIFATAYDEYALEAFDVHAVDYLLKPFSDERFEESLQRARKLIASDRLSEFRRQLAALLRDVGGDEPQVAGRGGGEAEPHAAASPAGATTRFPIKTRGRVVFVAADEVNWISAERDYVRLHTDQRGYLIREKIGNLEQQLRSKGFVRVHRSALVRLEAIDELHDIGDGRYVVRLADGSEIRMSRSGADRLQAALGRSF